MRSPDGAQQTLIESDPEHYFSPRYVGRRGWLGVYLDVHVDWNEIGDVVGDAYRVVAPARLPNLLWDAEQCKLVPDWRPTACMTQPSRHRSATVEKRSDVGSR